MNPKPRPAPKTPGPKNQGERITIRRLTRADLPAGTPALAQYLIGKIVVHDLPEGRVSGRIVETEAYLTGDAACHAFRGQTPRNRSLFLGRGHAYVYISYGMHRMLNVTGAEAGMGEGVLIRAIEPLDGLSHMQLRRGVSRPIDLTKGPGRLAQAMGIDLNLDGADLCGDGALWLGEAGGDTLEIGVSVRIGISKDTDRLLRFYEKGNRYVSGPRKLLDIGM
jgi:DNA-3-methyladenine glycosylase